MKMNKKVLIGLAALAGLFQNASANFWKDKDKKGVTFNYTKEDVTNVAGILEACANFIDGHRYGNFYPDWVSQAELTSLLRGKLGRPGSTMGTDEEASLASKALWRGEEQMNTDSAISRLKEVVSQMRDKSNKHWTLTTRSNRLGYVD